MSTTDELFDAIEAGDDAALSRLLSTSPDLARSTRDQMSTLRAAAYAGRPELGPVLRDCGAVPDAFDAAAYGWVDDLRELLDADPSLTHATTPDGFTALHLAAWFGRPRAAELLLARGADPERVAENPTHLRPLHSAAAGGHEVIVHLLLDRGADIEAAQAGGIRPLHSAAHRGDASMVALLLGRGADPAPSADDGRRPCDLTDDPVVLELLPPR